MERDILGTPAKALQINIDAARFGTFAEIGAGQEVTRWFFHVDAVSATVASDNQFIEPIPGTDVQQLHVAPGDVLTLLQAGDPAWEQLVPAPAVQLIKERGFFRRVS